MNDDQREICERAFAALDRTSGVEADMEVRRLRTLRGEDPVEWRAPDPLVFKTRFDEPPAARSSVGQSSTPGVGTSPTAPGVMDPATQQAFDLWCDSRIAKMFGDQISETIAEFTSD